MAGHNRANTNSARKIPAAHCSKSHRTRCASSVPPTSGTKDADTGNQSCNGARTHKFFRLVPRPVAEHKQHNADFRKDRDGVTRFVPDSEGRGQSAGQQESRRQPAVPCTCGRPAQKFCAQNNNRQIAKNGIHEISSPLGQSFISIYSFSTLCSSLQYDKTCKFMRLTRTFLRASCPAKIFFAKKCKIALDILCCDCYNSSLQSGAAQLKMWKDG